MMTRTQTLREPFQRELTSPGYVHMDLVETALAWIEHHGGDRSRSAILTAAGLIAQSDNRVSFKQLVLVCQLLSERFASNIQMEDLPHDVGRWHARRHAGPPRHTIHSSVTAAVASYRLMQDFDDVTLASQGAHIVAEHRSSGPISRLWCSLLAGYYEQTLLTARAFGVRVKELTCAARGDDACRFRLRWLQLDGEPGCVTTFGAPR